MQSHVQRQVPVVLPALIVLIGLLLRLMMLDVDARFHPDEALFAAQSRLINHQHDWNLRTTDLDKPPLTFYFTALSFRFFGATETAARLPNVLFSSLSVAGLYGLTNALYRDRRIAGLAALLLAVCPYDLAFSATVFTDVQATFWTLVAAWFAARDQWRRAGLASALLFAAKSNAMLFLPLIMILGITHYAQPDWTLRSVLRRLWQWSWPFAFGIGAIVLWDLGRAPRSFLRLGYQRNNPGRFIRSDELWPRLAQWRHWLGFITGSDVLMLILLIGIGLGLLVGLRHRSRVNAFDWQIAGFGIAFMAGHWLIAFNTYDRYLHTLVPFVLVLSARTVISLAHAVERWLFGTKLFSAHSIVVIMSAVLIGSMLPATITTLHGTANIGGDQRQHTGVDELADYLNTTLSGATVYDHWLGWELAYYLGPTPRIRLMYYPLPETLADQVRQQSTPGYFVAPSATVAAPWLAALYRADITTTIIYHEYFVIYALEPVYPR